MQEQKIELSVISEQRGIQLNATVFPIICPKCNNYFEELYHHKSSRYGFVGAVSCSCGERVNLIDSDNLVDYIKCHTKKKSVVLDFRTLFQLEPKNIKQLKKQLGYDLFKHHMNQTIALSDLVESIEKETGITAIPIKSKIPLPVEVKKWIALLRAPSLSINTLADRRQ
ncbi:hypothetical protein [Lewinella cohaerens]|uniref:hypothetical protein n=1 Tax=Lewinella cohaerens TaxID=70995 RepID=UPI00047810C6|nr:hypothetical protein [Lewinella cohaerens]